MPFNKLMHYLSLLLFTSTSLCQLVFIFASALSQLVDFESLNSEVIWTDD
jgi:hypothetical protein